MTTTGRGAVFVAIVALAYSAGAVARQSPAGQTPPIRTGLIVGQVIDAVSKAPVAEAIVSLQPTVNRAGDATRSRALTDPQGRFFFDSLPAGSYRLSAEKLGFAGGVFSKTRPSGSGAPLELAEGERIADAKIPIWKLGVVGGTVVDESGEPVIGVRVEALRRLTAAGRPAYRSPGFEAGAVTDDRGVYRIAALTPGEYVVVVRATQVSLPAPVLQQYFQSDHAGALQREMFSASSELSVTGTARNQQVGDTVVLTHSGMAKPLAPDDSGRFEIYPTTFSPATTNVEYASVISVEAGREQLGVALQLRPVKTARVSGRLLGPDGPVGLTALRLVSAAAADVLPTAGFEPVTGVSGANGAFTLLGVPAGQYVLRVLSPLADFGAPQPPSTPDQSVLWAMQALTVGDTDVTDLDVTLRPTIRVSGRLVDAAATPDAHVLADHDIIFELASGDTRRFSAHTDAQGRFETGVPPGLYIVKPDRLSGFDRWVRSIVVGSTNISSTPLEVKADPIGVTVTLTDRETTVSGVVRNASGAQDPSATVMLFPADRSRWTDYGSLQASRTIKSERTNRAGMFALADVAPGDYFLAAVADAALESWPSPAFFETLTKLAQRVSLSEGERRSVDLRTVVIR